MNKVILKIGGMTCSACSSGLEKYLNKQDGIKNASVNLVLSNALIEYDDTLNIKKIEEFIKKSGFESLGIYKEEKEVKNSKDKIFLIIFGILSLLVLYISMSHMLKLKEIPYLNIKYPVNYSITLFILTIPFIIYGKDIFISGIKNIIHKTPNMDTLVTIGVLSSLLYSIYNMIMVLKGSSNNVHNLYFESVAIIIFFIKLGRFIDNKSKEKTKEAIKELVTITPTSALIKIGDKEKEVTIDEVKKGDILICKPGMKIAVDGVITKGYSHIDEAFVTGESSKVKKTIDNKVVAGSINIDGYIEYKAEKIGKDSTISNIVKLVVEATNTKTKAQKLADKISSYFIPSIIIIALITFIGYIVLGYKVNEALVSFVTVLVVACPCALGLATPLAIVVSEGLCAKNGILVKSSEILENACKVDTVIFDKTGTLTYGTLKVSKIYNYSKYSDLDLLSEISLIESKSTHPISNAFKDYNSKLDIEVKDFENIPGIGLKAIVNNKKIYIGNNKLIKELNINNTHVSDEDALTKLGNSIVYIIENKDVIGLIGVKDIVRNSAKDTIKELKKMNKNVIMLTGDNKNTAKIIARSIGIDNVISEVYPSDKVDVIKKLIKENKSVMMVGDGINDAPSIVTATIGVSVNGGTDIAIDSADVILMNDDLKNITDLISISNMTLRNIKQNLFWAFFYNACMIPLAIGLLKPFNISMNPMFGGLAMMISSLTVVFNALRLKKWRRK